MAATSACKHVDGLGTLTHAHTGWDLALRGLTSAPVLPADWQGRENNEYFTRSCPLRKPKAEAIAEDALALVRRWASGKDGKWAIYSLGLSTSNFVAAPTGSSTLHRCVYRR